MKFTKTRLVGPSWIVDGTDKFNRSNRIKITSEAWAAVEEARQLAEASANYSAELNKIVGPLVAAAEGLRANNQYDQTHITLVESVDAVEGVTVPLDEGGVLLAAVDRGDFDRLIWLGDELVLLAD